MTQGRERRLTEFHLKAIYADVGPLNEWNATFSTAVNPVQK